MIALYKFLEEEQPYPPTSTVSLTSTESGVALGDSLKLVDMFEKRDTETVQGDGPGGGDHLDGVAASDWVVGFLHIEVNGPTVDDVSGADSVPGANGVPAVGDYSSNLFDRGATTDIQIYTAGFPSSAFSVPTSDLVKN